MGLVSHRSRARTALFRLLMILLAVAGIELVGWVAWRLSTTPTQRRLIED
jgi:hypothetical protein